MCVYIYIYRERERDDTNDNNNDNRPPGSRRPSASWCYTILYKL